MVFSAGVARFNVITFATEHTEPSNQWGAPGIAMGPTEEGSKERCPIPH